MSFDNPFPPVYGGVIEVFYKLRPLQQLGIAVHLHCFVNDIPQHNPDLDSVTEKVYYYRNSRHAFAFLSLLPFSVRSRDSRLLLDRLRETPAPILFEGLKTTYWRARAALDAPQYLRLHNLEQLYFDGLAQSENQLFKKLAYRMEALKYKRYERLIPGFDQTFALSVFENDQVQRMGGTSSYIPVFHGNDTVAALEGVGKYALYHGDLRASDNRRVAERLIGIFANIPDYELVIASGPASASYIGRKIAAYPNITYESLRDFDHLKTLLAQAHLNLVFSYQRSGTKLKLLNALFHSRFCLINENVIDDARVAELCVFVDSDASLRQAIDQYRNQPYQDYARRRALLETHMSDRVNARTLAQNIFFDDGMEP